MTFVRGAALISLLILTACGSQGGTESTTDTDRTRYVAPETDYSTPDRALKSYWAVLDAARNTDEARIIRVRGESQDLYDVRNQAVVPALHIPKPEPFPPQRFSRDIESVTTETESRAVVIAVIRNSSPIPEGAELTKLTEDSRRNGDTYRYVLERSSNEWKVAELWARETYGDRGWRKILPRDEAPMAPFMTFEGA